MFCRVLGLDGNDADKAMGSQRLLQGPVNKVSYPVLEFLRLFFSVDTETNDLSSVTAESLRQCAPPTLKDVEAAKVYIDDHASDSGAALVANGFNLGMLSLPAQYLIGQGYVHLPAQTQLQILKRAHEGCNGTPVFAVFDDRESAYEAFCILFRDYTANHSLKHAFKMRARSATDSKTYASHWAEGCTLAHDCNMRTYAFCCFLPHPASSWPTHLFTSLAMSLAECYQTLLNSSCVSQRHSGSSQEEQAASCIGLEKN